MTAAAGGRLGSMKQLGLVIGLYLCSIAALHFRSPHHNGTEDAHAAANAGVAAARASSQAATPSRPLALSDSIASKLAVNGDVHANSLVGSVPSASARPRASANEVQRLSAPTRQVGLNAGVADDSSSSGKDQAQPQQLKGGPSTKHEKVAAPPPAPHALPAKKAVYDARPAKIQTLDRKVSKPKPPSTPVPAADGIREGPGGNRGAWAGLGSGGIAAAAAGQPRGVVAYAVTITRDGPYVDGAAVLGQGVREAHLGKPGEGRTSAWDYALVAIVHPTVVAARAPLAALGWRVLERDMPFPLSAIENQVYAKAVVTNGCCGHLELLKLWAWSLTEYDWVVHLDMDSFVLGPMDDLFDTKFAPKTEGGGNGTMLYYTRDYNMSPGRPRLQAPVQGGFLCLRPDTWAAQQLWDTVRRGNHKPGLGWEGSRIGNFWGGMTIQGLVPYFIVKVAPAWYASEVDRCVYNQMVDAAGDPSSKSAPLAKMPVPNCRQTAYATTRNVHFTLCQKPWSCQRGHRQALCMSFHKAWMQARKDLEAQLGLPVSSACNKGLSGDKAYIPMKLGARVGGGGTAAPVRHQGHARGEAEVFG